MARAYTGVRAVYHQFFAGNCWRVPSERCFDGGLGPDAFDCSGFIIRVLADAMKLDVTDIAREYRHVRDMWQTSAGTSLFCQVDISTPTTLGVGDLLVTARRYTLDGIDRIVPGHIGIVTEGGATPSFIHASPESGVVEERLLNRPGRRQLDETMLGCLAIAE